VPHYCDRNIQNNNLSVFLNREDIIQATADQIIKDFGMFGIEISFSGETENAYCELHEQLIRQISVYDQKDHNRLLSVLYQVDITEREIAKATLELPHYSNIEILAHQIIFRELKKVLFRKYFKSKPDQDSTI
jgi:hypothetical protein